MSAETGVGPSIASGSQVCSGNCADLPITPPSTSSPMTVNQVSGAKPNVRTVASPARTASAIDGNEPSPANRAVPKVTSTATTPTRKK